MKITVCIGSYCHLKGSRTVVEQMRARIERDALGDQVELSGTFCMGKCQDDVSVSIGEETFSVAPDGVDAFFDTVVLPRLGA